MEQYIIKGGNPLVGEVEIGGAKNAALGILAAAIMADEPVLIENLPDVNDINVMLEAIEGIGAMVQRIDRHTVKINGNTIGDFSIDYDYIKKIRASYYLLGALLGKYKRAEVALPGGCNIGSRPIDQHLKGFRALGADVDIEYGKIVAEAEELKGTHLYFDVVTVGATITAYTNGYAVYEADDTHTVLDVNRCGDYRYDFNDGTYEVVPAEVFEEVEWTVRLVMEGERRLENNRSKISRDYEEFALSCDGTDWCDAAMVDFMEAENAEMLADEELRKLYAAMRKLTERQQEVVQLYFYKGLNQYEIADELGIARRSVGDCLEGALKKIRKNF